MPTRILTSFIVLMVALLANSAALTPPLANGTTYYVDWENGNDANDGRSTTAPWKRGPGMNGFSSNYSHQAGDRFIFKGGVIWPYSALPMTIVGSGEAESPDIYTTDHDWYSGGSWEQPVFDAGGTGTQLIRGSRKRYVIINDLSLRNVNTAGSAIRSYGIHLENCQEFALTNNRIQPYCWRAIYVVAYDGTTQNNITIQNNDISDSAVPITIATAAPGTVINNVEIGGNRIHDLSSMIVYAVHGDGVQIFTSFEPNDMTQSVSGRIHGNTFFGSVVRSSSVGTAGMTAWIYLAANNGDFVVYNNALSYSDRPSTANLFKALINVNQNSNGSTAIYNNTMRGTDPGMSAAIVLEHSQNVTVKNNILQGMRNCYDVDQVSGFTSDYNLFDTTYGSDWVGRLNGRFISQTQWKGLGFDTHSTIADPLLVLSAEDLRLQSGSPAIGRAFNLSEVFSTDRNGDPRTEPWDVGAYAAPPSDGSITASLGNHGEGQVITVYWMLPAGGGETDWIGLYNTADRGTLLDWNYTGGTASGSVTFAAPSTPGTYECSYHSRSFFSGTKTSNTVTIGTQRKASSDGYNLTASPSTISAGRTITVNWTAPEGSDAFDWIGLYSTDDRSTLLGWNYTNGAASGTMTFPAPTAAGTYDLTYFLRGSYTEKMKSDPITRGE